MEGGSHVVRRWLRRPEPLRQPLQAHAPLEGVHGGGDRGGRSRGRGRAHPPPWLRPAGTRAQCLSGRPPGLPAPAKLPRPPHGPPGAAGPGGRQQQRFLATRRPASRSAPAARASAARPAPASAPDPGPVSKAPDGSGRISLKATARTARFQQSLR